MVLYPYVSTVLVAVVVSRVIAVALARYNKQSLTWSLLSSRDSRPDALLTALLSLLLATLIVENTTSTYTALTLVLLWVVLERRIQNLGTESLQTWLQNHISTLGAAVLAGLIGTFGYWRSGADLLFAPASSQQQVLVLVWFTLLLVVSETTIISIRRSKIARLPTSRRLIRSLRISYSAVAIFGIGLVCAQKQFDANFIDTRFGYYLCILWVVGLSFWSYKMVYSKAKIHLQEELDHFKKQQKVAKIQSKKTKKRKK